MNKIRLQVALAKAGITSRRKAANLIESNHVRVNGKVVSEKGFRVDIFKDKIAVSKKIIAFQKKKYYILNKPEGAISTARDERGRKTVLDYVKEKDKRLYPVGRLDKNTTGLIILTNDGEITYRLTHPKFEVERVYEAKVKGLVKESDARRLKNGIIVDGKLTRADKVIFTKKAPEITVLTLTFHEGRKREIRRMFEVIGHEVLKLKRIAYGPLKLKGLKEGRIRELTKCEIARLKNL